MSAPRSFQLAVKSKAKKTEYEPRPYVFVSATETEQVEVDGEIVERPASRQVVANYPGDGVMSLMLASVGSDSSEIEALASIYSFLQSSFNTSDYRFLRRLVRDEELDYDLLMDLVQDMMEGWLAFPTQPQSDSPPSPQATGTRSTGRVRGPGSTQQNSLPVDS